MEPAHADAPITDMPLEVYLAESRTWERRREWMGWYRTEQESGSVETHLGEFPFSEIYADLDLLPPTAKP